MKKEKKINQKRGGRGMGDTVKTNVRSVNEN